MLPITTLYDYCEIKTPQTKDGYITWQSTKELTLQQIINFSSVLDFVCEYCYIWL